MRHNRKKVTLGRVIGPRRALLRGLAESFVLHGTMRTTKAKARALRGVVEPLVTKAKKGDLTARRAITRVLYTDAAINKMMKDIGPKYKERAGGYTRTTKLGPRTNDAAEMVRIEFV